MRLAEAGHLHTWTNVRDRYFGILRSTNSVVPEKWQNAKTASWYWPNSFRKRHQLKLHFRKRTYIEAQICSAFECNCDNRLFRKTCYFANSA